MKQKVIFENEFHNTSATAMANRAGRVAKLTPQQARRVEKKLCGMSDCCCGPQQWHIQFATGGNLCWEEQPDGSVNLPIKCYQD